MTIQHSAGGVIVRKKESRRELLCVTTKDGALALPKGHREAGESDEQTAIREIIEETGILHPKITMLLGQVEREGTDHDKSRSKKRITYFLMGGNGESFDHEENYVWVEWESALENLKHPEERSLLVDQRNQIFQSAMLNIGPVYHDLDEISLDIIALCQKNEIMRNAILKKDNLNNVVAVGKPLKSLHAGTSFEHLYFLLQRNMDMMAYHGVFPSVAILPRTLENVIDSDLPDNISFFFALHTLNLSDTKTFFFLNQIRKKMNIGGMCLIEGRGERDSVVLSGEVLAKNIIISHGKIVRAWTIDFVREQLVDRLGFSLLDFQSIRDDNNGQNIITHRFLLKKIHEKGF